MRRTIQSLPPAPVKHAAIIIAALAAPIVANAGIPVRLRHELTPGAVAVYTVTIDGQRVSRLDRVTESVSFSQRGTLTLAVLEKPNRRTARRAWMITLDSPEISALTRDGQPVTDPPSPKALGLPPQASQLRVAAVTASRADASPVGGSRVQQAALLVALDFAHWPDRVVDVDESWETPTEREELTGTWTHTYTGTEGRGADRLASGTFAYSGALAGPFTGVARIESARGTWTWRVAKRALESSRSEVVLTYGPPEAPRRLTMTVALELAERKQLDGDELDAARTELRTLADLASRGAVNAADRDALAAFIHDHPQSLWRSVATDLLERAAVDAETFAGLTPDDLRDALVKLVTRWQVIAIQGDLDALQPVRATFRELMESNRSALYTLAADKVANTRAMAIFCIAFGDEPGDLAKLTLACADEEALVRMWAAYGLAERRDPATDTDVIFKLLEDDEEKVRRRACMAVQTCIKQDSADRDRFVKRLLRMLATDPADEVHPYSAQALDAVATEKDLPELIKAESKQEVPTARWQLEQTIRRLGGVPKSASDR